MPRKIEAISMRPAALAPPMFSGEENILLWISRVKDHMEFVNLSPNQYVSYASQFLKENVYLWWSMEREKLTIDGAVISWEEFSSLIKKRYLPKSFSTAARLQLKQCYQGNDSVSSYNNRFQVISSTITGMDEESLVLQYIEGLRSYLKIEMMKQLPLPSSLSEALLQSVNVEDALKFSHQFKFSKSSSFPRYSSRPLSSSSITSSFNAPSSSYSSSERIPTRPLSFGTARNEHVNAIANKEFYHQNREENLNSIASFKRRSAGELEHLKQTGGCFLCGGFGHFKRNCPQLPLFNSQRFPKVSARRY